MNEDNCVLDEEEFYFLNDIFNEYIGCHEGEDLDRESNEFAKRDREKFNFIWNKINKLNDMAKEKQKNG